MDVIQRIISEIVARCGRAGMKVSDTLAAFVARTIVRQSSDLFQMDKELNEEDVEHLVTASVRRLHEADSPSLETIKMQVAFDAAYVAAEDRIDQEHVAKDRKLRDLQRAIVTVRADKTTNMDALTSLYRQIFNYLIVRAGADDLPDRNVEREIAAAMESVFPRVGLKSFVAMSTVDKKRQLAELASIVLGIRLFNRDMGKGGAGLLDVPILADADAQALLAGVGDEVTAAADACSRYTDVLVFAHHSRPRGVEDSHLARWNEELANRRQYLSYLQSLMEEVQGSASNIQGAQQAFERELVDLKSMVGSRTSVPKEQVYPKFDALAAAWTAMEAERRVLAARRETLHELAAFRNTYVSSLTEHWVREARRGGKADVAAVAVGAERLRPVVHARTDGDAQGADGGEEAAEGKGDAEEEEAAAAAAAAAAAGEEGADEVERLSLETTPEFMALPLEYQGYCPWTIAQRDGLLLPGNPSLGVVRYRDTYNVFVSESALKAFCRAPQRFVDTCLSMARRRPELIHLLRLQDKFPHVSISQLAGRRTATGAHPLLEPPLPATRNAGTETPVHFVEKHIDPHYHWNEWELRRRALKLANLRKAATTSAQTDLSFFRRDGEAQVFLPREKGTQTGASRGTNPLRSVTYVSGLRGGAVHAFEKPKAATEFAEDVARGDKVAVVNLTFEV